MKEKILFYFFFIYIYLEQSYSSDKKGYVVLVT